MAASEEIGIIGVDSFHYIVGDGERSKRFYTDILGWAATARSGAELTERTGQQSTVYDGGGARVVVTAPTRSDSYAGRFLERHPAGVNALLFQVEDIHKAWEFVTARGGTPTHPIKEARQAGQRFSEFGITTAFGDVLFGFVERSDWEGFGPGFDAVAGPSPAKRSFRFGKIDHITSNALTIAPARLWMEHVLGMEQCWEIEFHTQDVSGDTSSGTGLKSVVMWDPRSELKFPINEPLEPFFEEGQINLFVEQNRGPGIQHVALVVDDVVAAVRELRGGGARFLRTPGNYYDAVTARLAKQGVDVGAIEHSLDELRQMGILIDGKPENRYLIQIFMEDAATLYDQPDAGPFFYELIQRCGDDGFGGGNFRALFEAIEREQVDG